MKKILLLIACIAIAATSYAQVFVGGTFGVSTSKTTDSDRYTAFVLAPNVGMNINDNVAVGIDVLYKYADQSAVSVNNFSIGPFVRYYFWKKDKFGAFGEAQVQYNHASSSGSSLNGWGFNINPGLYYNMTDKWQLLAKTTLISYERVASGFDTNTLGISIAPCNVSIGVAYYF